MNKEEKETWISIIVGLLMGIFVTILLINSVGAVDIIAGESYQVDLGVPYAYYEIIGNISEVKLNITSNGTIINIQIDKYSQSDSFDIIFYDKKGEVIESYSTGGGGGRINYYGWEKPSEINELDELDKNIPLVDDIGKEIKEKNNWKIILIFIVFIISIILTIVWLILRA